MISIFSKSKSTSKPQSQMAVGTPIYKDWLRTMLTCLPFGIIAFSVAAVLERMSGQETHFDLIMHPIAAIGVGALWIMLLMKPQSLRFVVSLTCLGLSIFFVAKLISILFFLPEVANPLYQMTEGFFWLATIYLLAFLVPEIRVGHVIAMSFTVSIIAISVVYMWLSFSTGVVNWGVIYALVQLNLSIVVSLSLTFAFMRFREQFDVTKDQEASANQLARYDRLTGLPNRFMLQEELELYISAPETHNLAVLFIDIDGFKAVNDSLGHQYGDELLQHIAKRLNNTLLDSNDNKEREKNLNRDIVARISGDEFVFVIRDVKNQLHAESIAQTLLETIRAPFNLSGEHVHITSSIGICFYPKDGVKPTSLINHADIAMYEAKQSGKNKYCLYKEAMTEAARQERELARDLRLALTRNEFELLYQPIVNLQNNKIDKFEALLRWNHPQKGLISPALFIPIAEKVGLIVAIDRWVLNEASKVAQTWQSFLPGVAVAVNMSPVQFGMPDLAEHVLMTLRNTALAPELLEIEVTESVVIDNLNDSSECLNLLRNHGITTAIDDFGTGYSSLAYLQALPADIVKIDRSFVNNLALDNGSSEFTKELIKVILDLSEYLNRKIVAEGVETIEQLDWLRSIGCHLGQGSYFSMPMPYADIVSKYGSDYSFQNTSDVQGDGSLVLGL